MCLPFLFARSLELSVSHLHMLRTVVNTCAVLVVVVARDGLPAVVVSVAYCLSEPGNY